MSRLLLEPPWGLFLCDKADLDMKLTTHLRFTFEVTNVWSYAHNLRLQMYGAMPTIPLRVYMIYTRQLYFGIYS
jgi:hypothetical protein